MLDFLNKIWSALVALFTTFWGFITWFVYEGYSSLSEYRYTLSNALRDYFWTKSGHVNWYSNVIRPRSDFIDYYHYGETVYSAIDSKPDIQDYRTNLVWRLRDFIYNHVERAKLVTGVGWTAISGILNTPLPKWTYLLLNGIGIVQTYESGERPTLRSIIPIKTGLLDLGAEPKRGFLSHVGGTLYPKILDVVDKGYNTFVALSERVMQLLFLSAENSVNKIKALITTDYPGIKGLLDIASKIGSLMNKTPYERLLYLTGEPFEKLLGLTDKPDSTVFSFIYDKFVNWFFDRLFRWLFYEGL